MPSPLTLQILFVVLLSIMSAGLIFLAAEYLTNRHRRSARDLMRESEASVVFLFDDETLVDATASAREALRGRVGDETDWDRFVQVFGPHFSNLRQRLATLADEGRIVLGSGNSPDIRLDAEYWDGYVRLTYRHTGKSPEELAAELQRNALEDEVRALRAIAEDSPQLVWKEDETGQITWANRAYLDWAARRVPAPDNRTPPWPPAALFEQTENPSTHVPRLTRRLPTQLADKSETHWFDVTSILRGSEIVHFAVDADSTVRADETRRAFVQTIGKTFAELSIGLAIFDRKRRLMTFNPALIELTGLGFEFLSSSPMVHTVLDRLREARMLPEPKNYISWREEIAALESAAKNGTYCENWDLPNGQTYRVTGRPHPDGAIAFLFEDISAEVSLTRRFRSEIETIRAVLDGMEEAVAVFSPSGALTLTNLSYATLWGLPRGMDRNLTAETAFDATRMWADKCLPSTVWPRVRDFISGFEGRKPFSETVQMHDGRRVMLKLGPLPGGSTMVMMEKSRAAGNIRTLRRRAKENLSLSA